MPKDVLIYGPINSLSVMDMMKDMNELESGDELKLRINTNGGNPQDGVGVVAKFQEFDGAKSVQVDGRAYSTGCLFLLYTQNVTALDVSKFMIHRAGYPTWYESEYMTDAQKQDLISLNKDYEKAFRQKVNAQFFEAATGKKIKDIFNVEMEREDVFFDAKLAKKIGLVDRVVKLTPTAEAEIQSEMVQIAAKYTGGENDNENFASVPEAEAGKNEKNKSQIKNHNMNKKELLAAHPEICAELIADGVAKENTRVSAWMTGAAIDMDAVKAGIESGNDYTQKDMAEFAQKQTAQILKGATVTDADANKDVDLDANNAADKGSEGKEAPTAAEAFEAKVDAHLNLSK